MLKFHTKISHWLVYCLFFVCFFGTLALFDDEIITATRGDLSGASRAQAFAALAAKYPADAVLSIKNLRTGGLETAHFDPKDPKHKKKKSREFYGADGFEPYIKSGFFKVLHFKFAPVHGWAKELGKAASSLVALGLLVAFATGLMVLKPRQLGRLRAPKQRGRLHLAHVNFGILAGVFLLWFCASGVGLNYLQAIDKALNPPKVKNEAKISKTAPEKKHINKQAPDKPAAAAKFARSEAQIAALAAQLEAVAADAAERLGTEQLEILSVARKQWIIRPAAEFAFRTDGAANAHQLVYSGEKLVKSTAQKPAAGLAGVYNLFTDFHRLHAAPLWARLLIAAAGLAACCFMVYALKLASLARAFNYLAMPLACVCGAVWFLLAARYGSDALATNGFYAVFLLALIAGKFASVRASFSLMCALVLLALAALSFSALSGFAGVALLIMIIIKYKGARREI